MSDLLRYERCSHTEGHDSTSLTVATELYALLNDAGKAELRLGPEEILTLFVVYSLFLFRCVIHQLSMYLCGLYVL